MNVPGELRYSNDHEWARLEDGKIRLGITDYAQDALGDIVFVQLPDVGRRVEAGETISEVESTKSVGEIYAPVGGTVAAVNDDLSDAPDQINAEPYANGWMIDLQAPDGIPADLMDAAAYREFTAD